jgi:hypothetical protein
MNSYPQLIWLLVVKLYSYPQLEISYKTVINRLINIYKNINLYRVYLTILLVNIIYIIGSNK